MASHSRVLECDSFISIKDALELANVPINLLGLVCSKGVCEMSRGTDYYIVLKIMDESEPGRLLAVNFFSADPAKLPSVRTHGDIICLTRVEKFKYLSKLEFLSSLGSVSTQGGPFPVTQYPVFVHRAYCRVANWFHKLWLRDQLYSIKLHGRQHYCFYDKWSSSFALFDWKLSSNLIPYQKSSRYQAINIDRRLSELRRWMLLHPPEAVLEQSVYLRNISTDCSRDLVCKVLHIHEISERRWLLFVWDGTDTPPATLQFDLELEGSHPCPLHVEDSSPSLEVLSTFPTVGSVLRIFADKYHEGFEHLQRGCRWAKLSNVVFYLHFGMWNGSLKPCSNVVLLSEENLVVQYCLQTYKERGPLPGGHDADYFQSPTSITLSDWHSCKVVATLLESLTLTKVTHKFVSVVRMVSAKFYRVGELASLITQRYHFVVTLEDPTARVRAFIAGEDEAELLGDYRNSEELQKKMNKLLGVTDNDEHIPNCSRNPPWFLCALKSYYLDKNNPRHTRRYKIYGTKLLD